MAATLSSLVKAVRAEAGHALTPAQGLNSVETIKHLIRRTENELWTAFAWPQLVIRADIPVSVHQVEYQYPIEMPYDQIRQVYWADQGGSHWRLLEFGVPEDAITGSNTPSTTQTSPVVQSWDTYFNTKAGESRLHIWPSPTVPGTLRLRGLRPLNPLVNDDDYCTLDVTLLILFVSAELLARAKAEDADNKLKKAQRHLSKLLANQISNKQKVSTFGASRGVRSSFGRIRPGIDYIP